MDIDKLTYEELLDLNRKIVERLKFYDHMRNHAEMLNFSVGDKVKFTASGGQEQAGTLIKYNKKTVSVLTRDRRKWNVSPQLLTRVEPRELQEENSE